MQAACGLLTVLLAAPAPAPAQGVIHFVEGIYPTDPLYRINGDGTSLQLTSFPQSQASGYHVYGTAQSSYAGGRQFLYTRADGQMPNGNPSVDLMVWNEGTGQSKAITNIHGPLYLDLSTAPRWSNDGLDSFVSFILSNPVTKETSTYRAHVSATDIASPTFQPITLGDARLELVKYWGAGARGYWYWWNIEGTGFYYVDPNNSSNLRFRDIVGNSDPVMFSSPVDLGSNLRSSPTSDAHLVSATSSGILAVDLSTQYSGLIATASGTGLYNLRGPAFSPDGSVVAFGADRVAKLTYYPGVYKVPFGGGLVTRVTELQGAKNANGLYIDGISWTTP
jgi:Tol biopolymer transport system component